MAILTGCGGGSSTPTPTPPSINVSVSPSTASLSGGGSQAFTATVANDSANAGVTWSIGSGVGALSSNAATSVTYTAPTAVGATATVTLTASSKTDPSATVAATITLNPPSNQPTITAVTVSCNPTSVQTGQTSQCTPTVSGTGSYSSTVTWAVSGVQGGNSTVGTISAAGLYTAPSAIPATNPVTVTATSTAYTAISGSAAITLSLAPIPAGIYTGVGNQENMVALVFPSGNYMMLSYVAGTPPYINEIDTGTGSASDGTFTANDNQNMGLYVGYGGGADGQFKNYLDGVLSAAYVDNSSLSGTITYPEGGGVLSFLDPNPLQFVAGSTLAPASLSTIAGTYGGSFYISFMPPATGGTPCNYCSGATATVSISSTGVLSGTVTGTATCPNCVSPPADGIVTDTTACTVFGMVTPRTDLNAYDFSYTFADGTGADSCLFPTDLGGVSVSGIGYLDSSTGVLMIGALNATSGTAFTFAGASQ